MAHAPIKIIFKPSEDIISVDVSGAHAFRSNVALELVKSVAIENLNKVTFSVSITADGETLLDWHFPPDGVTLRQSDQTLLATTRVRYQPEQTVVVSAVCTTPKKELTATETFTAPIPPQPFPSWSWSNPIWEPPVPYPTDGNDHEWNEDDQEWLMIIY